MDRKVLLKTILYFHFELRRSANAQDTTTYLSGIVLTAQRIRTNKRVFLLKSRPVLVL
jgi:hypothetical protein